MDVSKLKTNQLIEIELIDENNRDKGVLKYPSRIEDIGTEYLSLAAPIQNSILINIRPGQPIQVIFRIKQFNYMFETRVVSRRANPIPLLIVEKPSGIKSVQQKREYVRLSINLPLRYQLLDTDNITPIIQGYTIDISAGGLLFITPHELLRSNQLELEITLNDEEIIRCTAKVVRVSIEEIDCLKRFKVAVGYEDITEAQRDKIFKFIFDKQREWIRKGLIE
ncbi:MAG: flagellar brake protein [Syntrophomonadaceae bacterium]